MDAFTLIVFGSLLLVVLLFLGVGLAYRNRPLAELLDKRANERWAAQAMIEEGDLPQMVESANEYRRKRGLPELTVEDFNARAREEQQRVLEQANKQLRAKAPKRRAARERRGF